jgi:hypothetical protein
MQGRPVPIPLPADGNCHGMEKVLSKLLYRRALLAPYCCLRSHHCIDNEVWRKGINELGTFRLQHGQIRDCHQKGAELSTQVCQ